tara:strand:+ start:40647 stop:41426 length:780 start_codon:yes stop_codon:yes gene_type:complete
MKNLLRFIQKFHVILLFILLESFCLTLYISNNQFQQSRFISYTQENVGKIFTYFSKVNQYINLSKENEYLRSQNAKLLTLLSHETEKNSKPLFKYIPARIVSNSVYKNNNFILLNKGKLDGVKKNMGIITENGVIGIVSTISDNYSRAISILNKTSSISVIHKESMQNGSLTWNGMNYTIAEINDIPNHAKLKIGDTISTNGYSSIFPEGINIGTIISFTKGTENGLYNIKIKFLNDMNKEKDVYIINSIYKEEKKSLL